MTDGMTDGGGGLRQWCEMRRKSLERARLPYEGLWRELRSLYEPSLGHALKGDIDLNADAALREDEQIFNSRPRILLHRLAAGLQSGITNQARQWFRFRARDRRRGGTSQERAYLDHATEVVQNAINRSNVYPALDQMYLRLGVFGNSAALLVPDGGGVRMILVDEGAYWLAADRTGRVSTLLRRINATIDQLREEFGESRLPESTRRRLRDGSREDRATVWNLVYPSDAGPRVPGVPKDRAFTSLYWLGGPPGTASGDSGPQGILDARSYTYNPIIAPRWSIRGGTAYGIGPGQIGLGDARELQSLELAFLKLVEQESDPAMLAPASMRGDPIDTGPGGITYYTEAPASTGTTRPVQRLFETRQSVEAVKIAIDQVDQRLRETFYQDLFALMMNLNLAPKTMTAREVSELSSEKVALLGPILTRLNSDLLGPLIDAVWAVLVFDAERSGDPYGLLDAPGSIAGEDFGVEYVSSLHVEQQASSRLTGLYRLLEFGTGLANIDQSVIAKMDTWRMMDIAAGSFFENGAVRDDRQAQAIMRQQQEAAAAEQELARSKAMAEQAKAVKNLSTAPVEGTASGEGSASPSALEAMAGYLSPAGGEQ